MELLEQPETRPSTTVRLELKILRDGQFDALECFTIPAPPNAMTPASTVGRGAEELRAHLRAWMFQALNGGLRMRFPAGVYSVSYAGETVLDRWDGNVLIGCDGAHATYCGIYACPRPR